MEYIKRFKIDSTDHCLEYNNYFFVLQSNDFHIIFISEFFVINRKKLTNLYHSVGMILILMNHR